MDGNILEKLTPSESDYGLFHRLPLEIRHLILAEAFGFRTIHIDLSFGYPLERKETPSSTLLKERRHCDLGSKLVPDENQPKGWQWFGCVCHRRSEWVAEECEEYKFRWDARMPGVHDDGCLRGVICSCETGTEQDHELDPCFIGIMGWLLSCHSACTEGLDALFSTCTFHISSFDLLLHLPKLIYPRLLCRITSLELLWGDNLYPPVHPLAEELWDKSKHEDDKMLRRLVRAIPEACPDIQKLHISIQFWVANTGGDHHPVHDRVPHFERNVLGPIEDMMRGLGPRAEFSVAIPTGIWALLFNQLYDIQGRDLTRDLNCRAIERFAKSLGSSGSEGSELKYWICCGWDDKRRCHWYDTCWDGERHQEMGCFGTPV